MMLAGNTIHLYFSYPEQITDPELLQHYQSLLTDDELSQMSRFYYARHRHQYLVTRALIRTSLSEYHPVDPSDWQFGTNGYGKPEIKHPDLKSPVRFNLSHSRGLIMCGVAREFDIGVDVEDAKRSTRAALNRLSNYFSAEEIAELNALPPKHQKQRFFDYWTLKESYIKARGMGLAIPLRKFSFQFHENRLSGFSTHPELNDDASSWRFWRIAIAQRYQVAVAINTSRDDIVINAFNSVPFASKEPVVLTFQ
jgi:4'-phosphopantetheinyl transferase